MDAVFIPTAERRKQVKLRTRSDLQISIQQYEGRYCQVVKDPVSLKYYRFNQHEFYIFSRLNGKNSLEDIRLEFEKEFAPDTLQLEEMEGFARQLVSAGLVQHDTPNAAKELFAKRGKQRNLKRIATWTNVLYIKLPVFDPDRLLTWMLKYTRWIFTRTFLWLSVSLMLAAALFVAFHYKTFYAKMPAYHEFFAFRTLLYMWLALGIVKVIHEFGHGLSCKAFGGESHEMGALFMCFSPALYCNVTDSWTVADKWKRIIISFAGIWVELIIAAIATFVWWWTPYWPFINNVAMCLMVLCSVSTFVFNANPLMRFDGYYILADWLEVPNLRERANRYLGNLFKEYGLGMEVQPEPYMALGRKILFLVYAIASFVYRWVVTIGILMFLANWLKPYKLETLSLVLAFGSLVSMMFWPTYRWIKGYRQRGKLPEMKRKNTSITLAIIAGIILLFALLPLPVSRVREIGVVQITDGNRENVFIPESGILLDVYVVDGQQVGKGTELAKLRGIELEFRYKQYLAERESASEQLTAINKRIANAPVEPQARAKLSEEKVKIQGQFNTASEMVEKYQKLLGESQLIKAPRAGVIAGVPKKEDILKTWEKGEPTPICSIGDPTKLRVLVPVNAADYREIRINLDELANRPQDERHLEVSILPSNRSDRIIKGRVTVLPDTDERNVPLALTHRGGGNLATKPGGDPNVNQPLVQTYLIPVEIEDPDNTLLPGTLATAKIHLKWRSAAWWTWRSVSSMLGIGLW